MDNIRNLRMSHLELLINLVCDVNDYIEIKSFIRNSVREGIITEYDADEMQDHLKDRKRLVKALLSV